MHEYVIKKLYYHYFILYLPFFTAFVFLLHCFMTRGNQREINRERAQKRAANAPKDKRIKIFFKNE